MSPFNLFYGGNLSGELEKLHLQIYPAKTRLEANDKFTKKVFNLTDDASVEIFQGAILSLIEKKAHRKAGDILSHFALNTSAEYVNSRPLNQFDRAVLSVCNSEWYAGNFFTTVAIIYRALTGKVGKGKTSAPSSTQRACILESIQKLMSTIVTSNTSDMCEYLKYNDGKPMNFTSALLPASYIEACIGGRDLTTIFFDRASPILEIARAKKQILTYDAVLLDVPNQQNTPMNITVKNYVMTRILEIKLHNLAPTITLDDVFAKCRISNASRDTKMNARNAIDSFLSQLKVQAVIKNFEWIKRGNRFSAVKITYPK